MWGGRALEGRLIELCVFVKEWERTAMVGLYGGFGGGSNAFGMVGAKLVRVEERIVSHYCFVRKVWARSMIPGSW